jgi:hypothetical protein
VTVCVRVRDVARTQSAAKTIDMCNNPLTKTPKLENAMRIAPEWVEYDTEVRACVRA